MSALFFGLYYLLNRNKENKNKEYNEKHKII